MVFGTIIGKYFSHITPSRLILIFCLALATGAAMPIMMWLFQSVINGLVNIGRGSARPPAHWYSSIKNIRNISFITLLDLATAIRNPPVIHMTPLKASLNGMQHWVQRVL